MNILPDLGLQKIPAANLAEAAIAILAVFENKVVSLNIVTKAT